MYFINRYDAAMQLIQPLDKYRNKDGVILAVPRGGVPIGYYLAKHFDFPLDLLMTKKIGHPLNSEYAIGAAGMEDNIIEEITGIPDGYVEKETARVQQQLKERYQKFMKRNEPADIKGKIVIVTDDGIATGRTVLATIKMLRGKRPAKLVVAVPVAAPQAAERIKLVVDDFICLYTPFPFYGVGRFYIDFSEVSDEDVSNLLKELNARGHKLHAN
jgi:predicted phosphoribosyltransferase